MKAQVVKYVTIKGMQVPVYAVPEKKSYSINVNRVMAGVCFGTILMVVIGIATFI